MSHTSALDGRLLFEQGDGGTFDPGEHPRHPVILDDGTAVAVGAHRVKSPFEQVLEGIPSEDACLAELAQFASESLASLSALRAFVLAPALARPEGRWASAIFNKRGQPVPAALLPRWLWAMRLTSAPWESGYDMASLVVVWAQHEPLEVEEAIWARIRALPWRSLAIQEQA